MRNDSLKQLKKPSALMRPAPFWSWNDKLDEAELRRQIREMAAKGWGSYFMHSRVGLVTGYLSDEWMRLVNACADEAAKTGTYAWLYDEDKWPSGYASGEVPRKNDAYRSKALVLLQKGEAGSNDEVFCSFRRVGKDYDICKRVAALESAWFNGTCYVDLMSPEAVREFIDCTHERYKAACGEHFGKSIPGIFTDEPCYLMCNHYNVPAVPWSDYLPEFFKKLKGYDIKDHLPLLFFDMDGYRKVRFDFYDAATELYKRSFTKQYYDWCDANGLIMTGHFMYEDTLRHQTQWSGDVMSHYEFMHWPGIDKLGRHIEQIVTCKQVSSVADQLGKERSFCEVYGCMGGQCSFFHRKWIGDWQAALGISFVNHHLSLYSMRGERKRDYPANLFYQQPWWEDERGFADYQARLCAAVSEGERLVDILVIQPLSSVWCEYSPLHNESNYADETRYDRPFAEISRRLMEEKLDYHYGNENLMAVHASVEGGKIKVGRHSYSCVVVPPVCNLRSSTLSLLKSCAKQGGKVIVIGSLPGFVDGVEMEVGIPGALIVPCVQDAVSEADRLFTNRIRTTDKLTGTNAPSVYIHSRKFGDSSRHLFVNTDDKREVHAVIDMSGSSELALMDLSDGKLFRPSLADGKVEVVLAPAGSLLAICGEEARELDGPLPPILGSGAAFMSFGRSVPPVLIDNFECEVMEWNTILLSDFVLELDGAKVYEGPVCGAWHKYFYPAAEGTSFRATYSFHSDCEVDGCFAAIEVAENLDAIMLNGEPVKPLKSRGELGPMDPDKSWRDINFTRVPLSSLQTGCNTLVIEGRKSNNITGLGCHTRVDNWETHLPTEAEEVYICGRFSLKRLSSGLYGIAEFKAPTGTNLTDEGFPFYCGRVRLKASFELANTGVKAMLKLNGASCASARVFVNGIDCGVLRWEPYVVDISKVVKPGGNVLEIDLATTLVNAFGPNRIAGIKDETRIGPLSFAEMSRFNESYELFDFGVSGAAIYLI